MNGSFKYVVIGDEGVGKTSLAIRYTDDLFEQKSHSSTIGVDFFSKYTNGIKINLWDTAGACRFNSIIKSFYRSSIGAIIVYDVTNRESFTNITKWIQDIRENTDEHCSIIILGNKMDSHHREVSTQEAKKISSDLNLPFFEVSAKTGENIKESFCYFNKINFSKKNIKHEQTINLQEPKRDCLC